MGAIHNGGEVVLSYDAEGSFGEALVLVKGTGANQVKLPAGANAGSVIGVAKQKGDASDIKYAKVPVVVAGLAEFTAQSAIAIGEYFKIHGTTGKVVAIGGEAAGTVVQVVGQAKTAASGDNDRFTGLLAPFQYQVDTP